jgi:hypothetical protein
MSKAARRVVWILLWISPLVLLCGLFMNVLVAAWSGELGGAAGPEAEVRTWPMMRGGLVMTLGVLFLAEGLVWLRRRSPPAAAQWIGFATLATMGVGLIVVGLVVADQGFDATGSVLHWDRARWSFVGPFAIACLVALLGGFGVARLVTRLTMWLIQGARAVWLRTAGRTPGPPP